MPRRPIPGLPNTELSRHRPAPDMKTPLLIPLSVIAMLLGSCALINQQGPAQPEDPQLSAQSSVISARFFEGLKEGRDDVYWPLMSPVQQSPGLKKDYKEIEPAMAGFISWTTQPKVSTMRSLDATPQFPGPFYVVERMAKFSDGNACLIAVVEFDRGNNGFVSSIYRGETAAQARAELQQALNEAG